VSADDVVDKARARKLPTEVDFLKAAATLSDEAVEAAWKQCHPGVTEYELSIAMTQEMLARGGNRVEHVCIGAGINTHTLRHKPSDKRLERGDLFYADFGVVKNMYGSGSGYWSDLCRMGVVGEPSREQRAHYKLLRDVQQAIIARMKPGARCNDLYLFAREAFLQAGVDDVLPNIGHSMARSRAQEKPVLEALDSTALEPNMVFAVGPSFRSGAERYELKDLVLVTDSGPKLLSDRWDTKDLFVLK
jgi:Xaa-Pro aminopeptidase